VDQALIVFLVVLWAVVLLPGALRARRRSTMSTVTGFGKAMDVLRPSARGGRQVLVIQDAERISGPIPLVEQVTDSASRRLREANARRRRTLLGLSGASAFSLLMAVLFGGSWWAMWLVLTAGIAAYVAWLRNIHIQRMQAEDVVSELADLREAREKARQPDEERYVFHAVGD
jgi:hypothetical protein